MAWTGCHLSLAGSPSTSSFPHSKLSVRMTLTLENKGLLVSSSHLGRILEKDNKRLQRKEVGPEFREDTHTYLINLNYILRVNGFSKLETLALSVESLYL